MIDFTPFIVSAKLSALTTFILFFTAFPIAWYLAHTKSKLKPYLEALSALPIVLPPTVLGFYILVFLSEKSLIGGAFKDVFDVRLVFNFYGILIASVIYSFPFMMQPLQSALETMPKSLMESSYTLGKSKLCTIAKVVIPNIKHSVIAACVITFAHTMGEFGVVLMVGGSIPGETKVASIAIYEHVEVMEYGVAHIYSILLIAVSFVTLLSVYVLKNRNKSA